MVEEEKEHEKHEENEENEGLQASEVCDGGREAVEIAPALLSLHPHGKHVVLAVGAQLRIFNMQERCPVALDKNILHHKDFIRAIKFNREGNLFVSAGDDKLVKLWDTESWLCIKTLNANKKISALSFSHNGEWLLYADKFGVVYVASTRSDEHTSLHDKSVQLLAHCCSIITSVECSMDGRFIVTADRDFKIRVSVFPEKPLNGAHEIQGFCLGHTSFVSCISFVGEESPELLVSGGGDGMVQLWDVDAARLLDTFHATMEARLAKNAEESQHPVAVTCIAVSKNGSLIAAGIESLDGVLFLNCNIGLKKLSLLQKLLLPEHFCPTSLQFSGKEQAWVVTGAASQQMSQKEVAWLKVFSNKSSDKGVEFEAVEKDSLPGGCLLFETIEGIESEDTRVLALADIVSVGLKNQLSKRQYTYEHREYRKRMRNDKKLKS